MYSSGSSLRKRPTIIDHDPILDNREPIAPSGRPLFKPKSPDPLENPEKPWQMDALGVHIIPGLLTWENAETLWATVDGLRQGSAFMVGDALNAIEAKFGERTYQLVGIGYTPDTLRNMQWVSRRIPISRRRPGLPWGYHQIVASLESWEQDEILDLVEKKRKLGELFRSQDLRDLVKERKEAKKPNIPNDEPAENPDNEITGDNLDPNIDTAESEQKNRDETESINSDREDEILPPSQSRPLLDDPRIERLRAVLPLVRELGGQIATRSHDPFVVRGVADEVLDTLGMAKGGLAGPLNDVVAAERLLPAGWTGAVKFGERGPVEPGSSVHGRQYSVTVRRPSTDRFAIGASAWLPAAILEAALAAIISDARSESH